MQNKIIKKDNIIYYNMDENIGKFKNDDEVFKKEYRIYKFFK